MAGVYFCDPDDIARGSKCMAFAGSVTHDRRAEKSADIVIDYRAAISSDFLTIVAERRARTRTLIIPRISRSRVFTCCVIMVLELLHAQSARSPISANTMFRSVAPRRSIYQLNLRNHTCVSFIILRLGFSDKTRRTVSDEGETTTRNSLPRPIGQSVRVVERLWARARALRVIFYGLFRQSGFSGLARPFQSRSLEA